eukprot:249121-Chlamydomonas_euryale.AAC.10
MVQEHGSLHHRRAAAGRDDGLAHLENAHLLQDADGGGAHRIAAVLVAGELLLVEQRHLDRTTAVGAEVSNVRHRCITRSSSEQGVSGRAQDGLAVHKWEESTHMTSHNSHVDPTPMNALPCPPMHPGRQ